MVPYVRKSLFKHYLLEYLKTTEDFNTLDLISIGDRELDDWISENKKSFLDIFGLTEEDFYIGNENLDKDLYAKALFETRREVYQAAEGLFHNLNTLQSRSGNQLPFTSVNLGTCILPEGRMVIKAMLEECLKGLGRFHKTSIFPCLIFQYGKGINSKPGEPNYDMYRLALQATAQRDYPNYANIDWSGNAGYDPNDPTTYFSTINKTVA